MSRIRKLRVDEMAPDPDVQIAFAMDERHGSRMAANWNPDLAGILAVVAAPDRRSNGIRWWIIDGRHRHFAADRLGLPTLLAEVFDPMTPPEKAALKLGRDRDRRHVSQVESFLVEVVERDPTAVEILGICEAHGYEIGKLRSGKPYNRIEAVMTLRSIHERGGPDWLDRVLGLNELWKDEPKVNQSPWLGALGAFVAKGYDERLTPAGRRQLQGVLPAKVQRKAQTELIGVTSGTGGRGDRSAVARLMAEHLRKTARIRPNPVG